MGITITQILLMCRKYRPRNLDLQRTQLLRIEDSKGTVSRDFPLLLLMVKKTLPGSLMDKHQRVSKCFRFSKDICNIRVVNDYADMSRQ